MVIVKRVYKLRERTVEIISLIEEYLKKRGSAPVSSIYVFVKSRRERETTMQNIIGQLNYHRDRFIKVSHGVYSLKEKK